MHVAVIIDDVDPGGAQKMLVRLASLWEDIPDRQLSVISLQEARPSRIAAELEGLGIPVHHFHADKLASPSRLYRLCRHLRAGDYDLVHTNLLYANVLGTIAARSARRPTIAGLRTTHDVDAPPKARERLEAKVVDRLATAVMAVGPVTAASHAHRFPRHDVVAIPNSVTLPQAVEAEAIAATRLELVGSTPGPVVLAVGRLFEHKGYRNLIEAFTQISARHGDAHLVIAGDGPFRSPLVDLIQATGLSERVHVLGYREDVDRLLAVADLWVSASHREGHPNALLEAMAAGCAVVATDVGECAATMPAGTGVLVPPRDTEALARAMSELLEDRAARRALGEAARRHVVAHHSPERWLEATNALYDEVLAVTNGRGR